LTPISKLKVEKIGEVERLNMVGKNREGTAIQNFLTRQMTPRCSKLGRLTFPATCNLILTNGQG